MAANFSSQERFAPEPSFCLSDYTMRVVCVIQLKWFKTIYF